MTLILLRTSITQRLAAAWLDVSEPYVSKVKSRLEPILSQPLAFAGITIGEAAATRPLVVDGTYIPTGNRRQTGRSNYSGKRGRQCLSVKVASDPEGGLIGVSTTVAGSAWSM
jgi:hypothetical protein